jgi:hypothetical protein
MIAWTGRLQGARVGGWPELADSSWPEVARLIRRRDRGAAAVTDPEIAVRPVAMEDGPSPCRPVDRVSRWHLRGP